MKSKRKLKQETMRKWCLLHLHITTRTAKDDEKELGRSEQLPGRDHLVHGSRDSVQSFATTPEHHCLQRSPPPVRPPRPSSMVLHDVQSWMNANVVQPTPLIMTGISYWRDPTILTNNIPDTVGIRYAVPVDARPDSAAVVEKRGNHHIRFAPRCRNKIQVKMPSILSSYPGKKSLLKIRSMPILRSHRSDHDAQSSSGSLSLTNLLSSSVSHESSARTTVDEQSGPDRRNNSSSERRRGASGHVGSARPRSWEQHQDMTPHGRLPATRESTRSLNLSSIAREDSLTNLSDVPTYFTGIQPPSYRTDAASIRTTSSFGCIDGLNRQSRSSGRTTRRNRGVRQKLRDFAQTLHLTRTL